MTRPIFPAVTGAAPTSGVTGPGTTHTRRAHNELQPLPRPGGRAAALVWLRLSLLLVLCVPSIGMIPAGAVALGQTIRGTALAYGFQADFFQTTTRPLAITAIKEAGFGWAKQQVRWEEYEIDDAE